MYKDKKKEETLGETEAIRIFKWKQLDDSENADDSGRSRPGGDGIAKTTVPLDSWNWSSRRWHAIVGLKAPTRITMSTQAR